MNSLSCFYELAEHFLNYNFFTPMLIVVISFLVNSNSNSQSGANWKDNSKN